MTDNKSSTVKLSSTLPNGVVGKVMKAVNRSRKTVSQILNGSTEDYSDDLVRDVWQAARLFVYEAKEGNENCLSEIDTILIQLKAA